MAIITDEDAGGGRVCPYQMAFMLDNWMRRLFQNPVKLLADYIREGNTVVDLGCGPGFFTIDMAEMVGSTGQVIAVDLQPGMLDRVRKKAFRKRVADRIAIHRCHPDRIGLECTADFMLAFYMVHETPNPRSFFEEAKSMLKAAGKLLVVEPKMHVSQASFDTMVEDAVRVGLKPVDYPTGMGGRGVLLAHG
ncbi:MAG: class I SAM-dependent methyltransferase [Deltaproteobacteria bacterium]|nr:class I SAM-dependent methyltransferase [Deltaproteobacteria bacterium]